jgi:hypothetical protein
MLDITPADAFDNMTTMEFKNNLTTVSFDFVYHIPATGAPAGTVVTIDFIVTDKKEVEATKTVTFTIVAPAALVNRYTTVLMGSQDNNELGSFYSTSTNVVFKQADAAANKAVIDLVYFFGASNKATVAAPADSDAQLVFSSLLDNTYNLTKFNDATGLTEAAFTALTTVDAFSSLTFGLTKANDLATNDIVAFETVAGKKGAFMVKSIVGTTYGESSTITLEVVVEK